MAHPGKQAAQSNDAPTKPQARILIKAVHGLMSHPYNHAVYSTDSITEVTEVDDWLKCQIEAGKLEVL